MWTPKPQRQPRGLSIRAKTRVSMGAFRVGVDGDTVEVVGAHGPRGLGTDIPSFPIQAPPSTVVFVLCHPSHWPEPSHGTTKDTKPECTARIQSKIAAPILPCVDVPLCPPLSAQPHHLPKLDDPKWTEMDRKIRGRGKTQPHRTNSEQLHRR